MLVVLDSLEFDDPTGDAFEAQPLSAEEQRFRIQPQPAQQATGEIQESAISQ